MRYRIQIVSLVVFTALVFLARYPLEERVPTHAFLRADPLIIVSVILSTKQVAVSLWPALTVIAATVIMARFFCSHLCPLGTLIDWMDGWLGHPRPDRNSGHLPGIRGDQPRALRNGGGRSTYVAWRNLKFYLLAGLAAGALAGWNGAFWLDPIALLTRAYALILYPLSVMVVNLGLDAVRPIAKWVGWLALSHLSLSQPLFFTTMLVAILMGIVFLAGRFGRRFWCRNVCPLGALLGLLSLWAPFQRKVAEGCIECGKCQDFCSMDAIGADPRTHREEECTLCFTCEEVCPVDVISFGYASGGHRGTQRVAWDPSRRRVLWGIAGGAALSFFHAAMPYRVRRTDAIVRPPGALPEGQFLMQCIRCGQCMRACLTNTLQPALWEAGPEGIWSPLMDLRFAPCEQTCNVCGLVCPTGAIRPLDLEEKKHARVGTAVILKDRCLVWERDRVCLICDEVCPYNAIVFRPVDGVRRPFVIEEQCNGCGYCEHKCPVGGQSAIVVTPMDEFRLATGSYIAEARRRHMRFELDPGTDRFLIEESGLSVSPKKGRMIPEGNIIPESGRGLMDSQRPPLPGGFIREKP